MKSPCIRQSRTAVSAGSQLSLRQFEDECTANLRRLQYDSTETALRIENFLNRLKNFCSLPTLLQLRWDCTKTALRLRWDCAETQKTEKCSICSGVAVKVAKVWDLYFYFFNFWRCGSLYFLHYGIQLEFKNKTFQKLFKEILFQFILLASEMSWLWNAIAYSNAALGIKIFRINFSS